MRHDDICKHMSSCPSVERTCFLVVWEIFPDFRKRFVWVLFSCALICEATLKNEACHASVMHCRFLIQAPVLRPLTKRIACNPLLGLTQTNCSYDHLHSMNYDCTTKVNACVHKHTLMRKAAEGLFIKVTVQTWQVKTRYE